MSLTPDERDEALLTIRRGLDEDLRYGPDVTTLATVPAAARSEAALVARESGAAAGVDEENCDDPDCSRDILRRNLRRSQDERTHDECCLEHVFRNTAHELRIRAQRR